MKSSRSRVAAAPGRRLRRSACGAGRDRRSRAGAPTRRSPVPLAYRAAAVTRKTGGHDQVRSRAQQLDAGLVADLHPSAGQQRDPAPQVRQLGALGEVELRARRAQLIVKMVDCRVLLLADVAVLRFQRLPQVRIPNLPSARIRDGGKTFGVVNTVCRRSVRIPVPLSAWSSRLTFSAFRRRALARTSWRRATASGAYTWPAACSRRRRSSGGTICARTARSETIDSSSLVAARSRSRNAASGRSSGCMMSGVVMARSLTGGWAPVMLRGRLHSREAEAGARPVWPSNCPSTRRTQPDLHSSLNSSGGVNGR